MEQKLHDKQQRFLDLAETYKDIIAKVCSVYATHEAPFADLYQEVMINLWIGLDGYRGDAKASTWSYRIALNSWITWMKRSRRQSGNVVELEAGMQIPDADTDTAQQIGLLYNMISRLEPFDKALITLWLDEKSYDEISTILGISKPNVAIRLHRVREKLTKLAEQ